MELAVLTAHAALDHFDRLFAQVVVMNNAEKLEYVRVLPHQLFYIERGCGNFRIWRHQGEISPLQ